MTDEVKHRKISFASLPIPDSFPKGDSWFDWVASTIVDNYVTFALVRSANGQEHWEVTASSIYQVSESQFRGFQAGAVYEAEVGTRTILGEKVSAETYLNFHDALEAVDITHLPCEVWMNIVVPSSSEDHVMQRGQYRWDHTCTTIERLDGRLIIDRPLRHAGDWAFMQNLSWPTTLTLRPLARETNTTSEPQAPAHKNLELFA